MSMLYMSNGSNWIKSRGLYGSFWNIHLNTTLLHIHCTNKYTLSFSYVLCTPLIFFEVLPSFLVFLKMTKEVWVLAWIYMFQPNQCRLVQSGNVPVSMPEHMTGMGTQTFKFDCSFKFAGLNNKPTFNGSAFRTVNCICTMNYWRQFFYIL
jgi:hypothetical protein